MRYLTLSQSQNRADNAFDVMNCVNEHVDMVNQYIFYSDNHAYVDISHVSNKFLFD